MHISQKGYLNLFLPKEKENSSTCQRIVQNCPKLWSHVIYRYMFLVVTVNFVSTQEQWLWCTDKEKCLSKSDVVAIVMYSLVVCQFCIDIYVYLFLVIISEHISMHVSVYIALNSSFLKYLLLKFTCILQQCLLFDSVD